MILLAACLSGCPIAPAVTTASPTPLQVAALQAATVVTGVVRASKSIRGVLPTGGGHVVPTGGATWCPRAAAGSCRPAARGCWRLPKSP